MRYKLTKPQIRRLIAGEYLTDERGMKHGAIGNAKTRLQEINDNNLYDMVNIYLNTEKNGLEFVWKEYPAELKSMEEKR